MIPLNLWEHQNTIKTLYSKCVSGICIKYNLTRMELDILLFLSNNPHFDTATDIVEIRYLSKSQVSSSVKLLVRRGFIKKEYSKDNHKTAHLKICDTASSIIADGRAAQEKFIAIMLKNFTQAEIDCIKQHTNRICQNIDNYLKEDIK